MATLVSFTVENYRSIQDPVQINFPPNKPVVLIGENNAGKSNIVKALNLLLGNFWPGNHDPDDHEFYARDRTRKIVLQARFSEQVPYGRFTSVEWAYDPIEKKPNFRGQFEIGVENWGYLRTEDRDTCICIPLEAERNLNYQLGYSSKYTLLSKLMHRFHRVLVDHDQIRSDLEDLFQEVKDKFGEIPEFSAFTQTLREQLEDLISSMTHKLEVDFEAYNPTNFFHALRLQANDGLAPRTLDEMGTGESQILGICFAYAFAQAFHGGIVLVIEEPEAHLHPLAQEWLAQRLHLLAAGGLQVLLTTHSAHFINIMALDGLVVVRKDDDGTYVTQMSSEDLARRCVEQGAPAGRVKGDSILPFYRSAAMPDILEGFFAKVVVLVEGQTEKLALPIYLSKCGINHTKEGIALVPVYGKGSLAKWRRLFVAYEIPVYIVFDNDATDDTTGTKRKDALSSVGITGDDSDEVLRQTEFLLEDRFCVFGDDFERCMRRLFPEYERLEEEARTAGGVGKPFVARYVAEHLPYAENQVGWKLMKQLAEKLQTLVAEA